jgi:hypothetical protein
VVKSANYKAPHWAVFLTSVISFATGPNNLIILLPNRLLYRVILLGQDTKLDTNTNIAGKIVVVV